MLAELDIPWEAVEWPVLWKDTAAAAHMFDWTINLGQVGIAATFVFSLGVWATAQKYALIQVKEQIKNDAKQAADRALAISATVAEFKASVLARLEKFETRQEDTSKMLVAIARHEERQEAFEDKLVEFRRQIDNLTMDVGIMRQVNQVPTRIIDAVKNSESK